jgi:16S rRNA (guanine527-N7)-methyltransferase
MGRRERAPGKSRETEPRDLLAAGMTVLGLEPAPGILDDLLLYLAELKLWNARINLTGLKTDRDMVIKHFLDSLAVLPLMGEAASLADLGSGAGFPGLVLKLARREMGLILVEARGKKAAFLEYLASRLGLTGVTVVQTHLTPAAARQWHPKVAAVASRAAFPVGRFLELAAPLLAPGGLALALKGAQLTAEEWEAGQAAATRLHLTPPEECRYELPLSREPRLLIRVRKA